MQFTQERPRVSVSSDVWPWGSPQHAYDLYRATGLKVSLDIMAFWMHHPFTKTSGMNEIEEMSRGVQKYPFSGVHYRLGASKWPHQHTKSPADWVLIKTADLLMPELDYTFFQKIEQVGRLYGEMGVTIHYIEAERRIEEYARLFRHAKYSYLAIENSPGLPDGLVCDLVKKYKDLGVKRVEEKFDLVHLLIALTGGDTSVESIIRNRKPLAKAMRRKSDKHVADGIKKDDRIPMQALIYKDPSIPEEWFGSMNANGDKFTFEAQDQGYGVELGRWKIEIERRKRLNDSYLKLGLLREDDFDSSHRF